MRWQARVASAICSEGYELSGHNTPACGGAATSYLLAADKTINPIHARPGPRSSPFLRCPRRCLLSQTPTQPLSQRCRGMAAWRAPLVPRIRPSSSTGRPSAGSRRGSGQGCRRLLPLQAQLLRLPGPGALRPSISKRPGRTVVTAKHFITPTLAVPSTAGTLLVAEIRSDATPTKFTAPAGWAAAGGAKPVGSQSAHEIWYYPNNAGRHLERNLHDHSGQQSTPPRRSLNGETSPR